MFTAMTENDQIVSVFGQQNRIQLEMLRKNERFFCPACREPVSLKLGVYKIFHFAHKRNSECQAASEPESEFHLLGKTHLFHWLQHQNMKPKLEPFLTKIKQKPDILFYLQNKAYALEYQCSAIPHHLFKQRTSGYFSIGITPIWILGAKNINRLTTSLFRLSPFSLLFCQKNNQWSIPYYSPDHSSFIFLHQLYPVSSQKFMGNYTVIPNQKLAFSSLITPKLPTSNVSHFKNWRKYRLKWQTTYHLYSQSLYNPFLIELYKKQIPLPCLPPEIGWPVENMIEIETAPFIWQTYLWLDLFMKKAKGSRILFKEVCFYFRKRLVNKQIILREFPLINTTGFESSINAYLNFLVNVGVLSRIDVDQYIVNRPLRSSIDLMEAQKREELFFSQLMKSISCMKFD